MYVELCTFEKTNVAVTMVSLVLALFLMKYTCVYDMYFSSIQIHFVFSCLIHFVLYHSADVHFIKNVFAFDVYIN